MSIPNSRLEVATRAGSRPGFERVLDQHPLFFGDRSVMGADQLLAGQLVQVRGQPFGEPARVDEDDRRPVGADQLEDPRVDRRPDAASRSLLFRADHGRRPAVHLGATFEVRHVVDGDLDRDLELLDASGIDDGHRAPGFRQGSVPSPPAAVASPKGRSVAAQLS